MAIRVNPQTKIIEDTREREAQVAELGMQTRPKTAIERLKEKGPQSLQYRYSTSRLTDKQFNPYSDESFAYYRQGKDDPNLPDTIKPTKFNFQDQERVRQEQEFIDLKRREEAGIDELAAQQQREETVDPIADIRPEITLDANERRKLLAAEAAGQSFAPTTQNLVNKIAPQGESVTSILNDGFGQTVARGDKLVAGVWGKVSPEIAGAGTDIQMAYAKPAQAKSMIKATIASAIDEGRGRSNVLRGGEETLRMPANLNQNEQALFNEKMDAEQRMANDAPKTFLDYLNDYHPGISFNPLSLKGIFFDPNGFNGGVFLPNPLTRTKQNQMLVDPKLIRIMNFVTEKHLLQTQYVPALGTEASQELVDQGVIRPEQLELFEDGPSGEAPAQIEQGGASRVAGASRLGREIYKEWKREQNRALGRPTSNYNVNALTNDQYETIGAFARDAWQSTNPDLMTKETTGNIVKYQLTEWGLKALEASAQSAPDAFKNVERKPRLVTTPNALPSDQQANVKTTAIYNRKLRQVEEGRLNMNSIPHKIDTLRSKLSIQLIFEALRQAKSQQDLDPVGDLFKLGPEKFRAFQGEKDRKIAERVQKLSGPGSKSITFDGDLYEIAKAEIDAEYDPAYEMDKQFTRALEFLNTIGRYSNGAYHLDFVLQELTTRMHVDQTRFNPQLIPWVRYITGGVEPTTFNPKAASEEHGTFKELMAILFIPGGKKALPKVRERMFDEAMAESGQPGSLFDAIAAEGAVVEESLMNAEAHEETLGLLREIGPSVNPRQQNKMMMNPETGQMEPATLTDNTYIKVPEQLANVPLLNIPDSLMARTRDSAGLSEDLDGVHRIEAAIEMKKYLQAIKNGTKFTTNIGIEYDGKTHGVSSFLATLGAIKQGYRTGVFRKTGAEKNLDELPVAELAEVEGLSPAEIEKRAGDIRDAMGYYMESNGLEYAVNGFGVDGTTGQKLYEILNLAIQDRDNFLKQPVMTLSYGRLIQRLDAEVRQTVLAGDFSSPIRDIIADLKNTKALDKKLDHKNGQTEEHFVIDYLHNILADSIDSELHPGVLEVGQLLRANNIVATMSNDIMEIENALGFKSYIGAKESIKKIDRDTGQPVMSDISILTSKINPDGKQVVVKGIGMRESVPSGSAPRDGRPGGWARGRLIPAIIQAIDGAWMNKMFTGSSWNKLQGQYMLPIMDAVKTDIKGGAAVRREANKNWSEVTKTYSPYKSLMMDWTPGAIARFEKKLEDMGDQVVSFDAVNLAIAREFARKNQAVDEEFTREDSMRIIATELGPFKMFYNLMHATKPTFYVEPGKLSLNNLVELLEDTMEFRPRDKKKVDKETKNIRPETISEYSFAKKLAAMNMADRIMTVNIDGKKSGPAVDIQKANLNADSRFKYIGAEPRKELNAKQMLYIFRKMIRELKLVERNKAFVEGNDKAKEQYFKELMKRLNDVFQIDAG